ncbi:MAG: leucine-rich repeat domain-containing protein [Alistipes sp.]|nr:leucine-rich repeat domain-containing protein [Alistipes sp.]
MTIGEQVTEIADYMFGGQRIVSFDIPDHITKIGVGAFSGCYKLTSITIPTSVEQIGYDAFYDCGALATVRIEDSATPLKLACAYGSIFGTDEVGPFYYSPLKEIYLGREIDYLKHDGTAQIPDEWAEGVFANKQHDEETLETTLTISDHVKTLSKWMFSGVRVKSVTIPTSVTKMEYRLFEDCRILTEVTMKSTTPPTLGAAVFDSCDLFVGSGTIRVPSSALSSYQSASGWSTYASKMVGY